MSRPRLHQALLGLQGVFREAERRGWNVVPVDHKRYTSSSGVAINVGGHCYPIEVIELVDRTPLTSQELEAWRYG